MPGCTHGIESLLGKYEEKKSLKRSRRRWKDNNKSDFGEIIFVNVDLIHLMADLYIQTGAEPTDTFWHANYLDNKKGNEPVLCKRQIIYYLCIAFNRQHLEGGLLQLQEFVLNHSKNYKKLDAKLLIYGRNSNPNSTSQLLYYVGRFLQTHSFTNTRRKKYRTVKSGDSTGHDLPDT